MGRCVMLRLRARSTEPLARAPDASVACCAASFSWEGTATLRFCVGPGGEATQLQVAHSSGRALLDEAATDCVVREAQPFPPVKDCLVVDVRFAK